MSRERRPPTDAESASDRGDDGVPGKRSAAARAFGDRRAETVDAPAGRFPFLDVIQMQDAGPAGSGPAVSAAALRSRLAEMRTASLDFVAARDRLDAGAVGEVGMALARAAAEAEAARPQLGGASRDELDADHAAWTIVVTNRVRPTRFRGEDVAGTSAQLPPADLAGFIREQVVKTILLVDAAAEIGALRAGRRGQGVRGMVALEQQAVERLQFWSSDREGFLFLAHVLGRTGEGSLLDRRGADGAALRQTVAAVARGVPQRMDEVIDVVREAQARAADDPEGAARLVELARARLDELVQYDRVRAAIPKGTHGRTLEDAWRLAQDAQHEVHALWFSLKTGERFGDGVWALAVKRLEAAATILDVVTGETAYEASPYPLMGLGADVAPAMVGASAAAAVTGALAFEAAVGSGAYAAAALVVVRNPYAATAIAELAASIGFSVVDAGGVESFLENLKTPEGLLQVTLEVLALKQSLGGGRHAAGDGDAPGRGAPRRGVADEVLDIVDRVRAVKGAVVEWGARPAAGPDAVTPGGGRIPGAAVPDQAPGFSTVYSKHLGEHRQVRAARASAAAAAELARIRVTAAQGAYHVTPDDGRRMATLFRDLDGAQVIEYRAGILVRADGKEWYFELSEHAHAPGTNRTRALTPDDATLGLPAANVSTVELWGFRGVRTIQKPGDPHPRGKQEWSAEEAADIKNATDVEPLLEFGHVGISWNGGLTIRALTPRPSTTLDIPTLKQQLKNGEIFPGQVADDARVFRIAERMADKHGWNTRPIRAVVLLDPEEGAQLRAKVEAQEGRSSNDDPSIGHYGFPKPAEGSCAASNNCATYPRHVGLPLPEQSGNLRDYIPALERWANADAPIDARNEESAP